MWMHPLRLRRNQVHCVSYRVSRSDPALPAAIKLAEKFRRDLVVYLPKCDDDGIDPGEQERFREAEVLLTCDFRCYTAPASRKHHELCAQARFQYVPRGKLPIRQAHGHWVT